MNFNSETIKKIRRNKPKLERKLGVRIKIDASEIKISGNELNTYIAEKVLQAIDKAFPIRTALLLINEDYILEDIPIKNITKKKNLSQVRARIIGTKGKTLKTLSKLTDCHITLHDNTVSLIGPSGSIKEAITAIESLIRGSKQGNVYSYLEKIMKENIDKWSLGLKE